MAPEERADVITVLTWDHREVEALFARLETTVPPPGEMQQRRDLADQLIMELVRHAVAEEQHLYPAVRQHLPDGDQLADKELADHAEIERTMHELDGVDPKDSRFDELVETQRTRVGEHLADVEGRLFPQLATAVDPETLLQLGDKVESAKRAAPTRPHPAAPDRPPLNKILGPGTALVDRIRDALTGRGRSS